MISSSLSTGAGEMVAEASVASESSQFNRMTVSEALKVPM